MTPARRRSILLICDPESRSPGRGWTTCAATRRTKRQPATASVRDRPSSATSLRPRRCSWARRALHIGTRSKAEPYSAFKRTHSDDETTPATEGRRHVVYTGANDGMLHAFDAEDGEELFAFIPSPAFRNLRVAVRPRLHAQVFRRRRAQHGRRVHQRQMETVLVGGLNTGGQGIYSLDITDPDDVHRSQRRRASSCGSSRTQTTRDLGYTYSQPAIVRLQNGRWGAIFGNGYNNTEDDTAVGGRRERHRQRRSLHRRPGRWIDHPETRHGRRYGRRS